MKISKKILSAITLTLSVFIFAACAPTVQEPVNAKPVFSGVGAVANHQVNTPFDPLAGVSAADAEDGDLTEDIVITANTVNVDFLGNYVVSYSVTDSEGAVTIANRAVTVGWNEVPPLAQYLSGVELAQLTADQKGILFAAAERYLLDNVYAGVPLYTQATRVIYSDRVQLFSPEFNGVMGYGTGFSQFNKDDSTVKMTGDTLGTAGQYTWRSTFRTDPSTLNPWTADDSNSDDFITLFTGGLYDFYFDDTKTGYEINPSLAASEPVAVDGYELNGRTYAKTWRISLKDDLTWKFHPDTETSGFAAGFETLDANDYLWTWKKALTDNWFRAISGGGDFISGGIKGAAAYAAAPTEANWANVGIRKIDDLTFELEYISDQSQFDVKYSFAGNSKPALQKELFEALGLAGYGLGPTSVASSGPYYFDSYKPGQLLTFKKNDQHPDTEMYHYTGYQFRFVPDTNVAWQEFLAGRLESGSVPAAEIPNYASDPRVKIAPDPTTWRLVMNGFGTVANRDAYIAEHPELGLSESFVPEPIVSYKEFRQALFYGFDRISATGSVPAYTPAWTMYTSTYFLDAEGGISVRGTTEGQAVSDDFGGETAGFIPDAAVSLFKQAVAKAIADGHYVAGTAAAPTIIPLTLTWGSSGSVNAQTMVSILVDQYNTLLVDDVNHVKIEITVNDITHPNQYYDYMMTGGTDLGIGGISGSLLDAPDFMDVFRDDNYGGFTLDWGIDTSTPNIDVTYVNTSGTEVTERWSFNALINALNRKTYVKNGQIQTAWEDSEELIKAYIDVAGGEVESIGAGDVALAEAILGMTLAEKAEALGFDSAAAYLVVTKTDEEYLFVLGKSGDNFELVLQIGLARDAEAAIKAHNSGYDLKAISPAPLTIEELNAIAYVSKNYDFVTLDDVWAEVEVPAGVTAFVYSTQFNTYATDAYVVLKIGDYYVGWAWL